MKKMTGAKVGGRNYSGNGFQSLLRIIFLTEGNMWKITAYKILKKGAASFEFLNDGKFMTEDAEAVKKQILEKIKSGEIKLKESEVEYVVIPEKINDLDSKELTDRMKIYREELKL